MNDYSQYPIYIDDVGRSYYVLPDGVTLIPVSETGEDMKYGPGGPAKFTPPFVPDNRRVTPKLPGAGTDAKVSTGLSNQALLIGGAILVGAVLLARRR